MKRDELINRVRSERLCSELEPDKPFDAQVERLLLFVQAEHLQRKAKTFHDIDAARAKEQT